MLDFRRPTALGPDGNRGDGRGIGKRESGIENEEKWVEANGTASIAGVVREKPMGFAE